MVRNNLIKNLVTLGKFKQFQQNVDNNFKEIKKILGQHTNALLSIENTMKLYGDMYQVNKESIDRLNIRMESLERA
jgi:hypothetical protein